MEKFILPAAIIALVSFFALYTLRSYTDCTESGGVLVVGLLQYQCVTPHPLPERD